MEPPSYTGSSGTVPVVTEMPWAKHGDDKCTLCCQIPIANADRQSGQKYVGCGNDCALKFPLKYFVTVAVINQLAGEMSLSIVNRHRIDNDHQNLIHHVSVHYPLTTPLKDYRMMVDMDQALR